MKFWRQEDPIFGEDGKILVGGMFPHQREWWTSTAFIRALVMGYGGGKTLIAGKRAIIMAMVNAPVPYMVVSPSYKQAKRTIIPTIIASLKGRRIPYRYNKTDFEFQLPHGGIIWIGSGEVPDSLKGPNLCGAGIDEPFIQPKEVFEQMLARVRDPRAVHREITLTGTPEDLNWGYDICEGDERDNYDLELIQAPTSANLSLPEVYVETLTRAYDPKIAEAYVGGKFVNLSTGRKYYGFERARNVIKKKISKENPIYLGLDFNVNPMAGTLFQTEGPRMHFFKEIELPNSNTEAMIEEAQKQAGGRLEIAFPDPSGKSRKTSAPVGKTDFTIIQAAGIEVKARKQAPTIRNRENAVNKKLSNATITIDPGCKSIIRGLEQLTQEKAHLADQKKMGHVIDAFGYPVEYLHPIKKPRLGGRYHVG